MDKIRNAARQAFAAPATAAFIQSSSPAQEQGA
jgi:hypothetical protein